MRPWFIPQICMILGAFTTSTGAFASADLLPEGIGLYQFGYRPYLDVTEKFNSEGKSELLSKPFNNHFDGPGLLNGVGGSELKRLADHLQRFDGFSNSPNNLIQGIELGTLKGDVKANIDARYFGLGFGWSPNITVFAGVPWVDASVRTNIQFGGYNNAAAIKQRLGQAAFEELQSGLDQAAAMSAGRIKQSFVDAGYAPIDYWETQGIGDIQLGATAGRKFRAGRSMKAAQSWKATLSLPTGYEDDADVLTDVGLSKGYASLLNEASHTVSLRSGLSFGVQAGLGLNLPATVERRVPEANETLVAANRKTDVDLTPGTDFFGKARLGYSLGILDFGFDLGFDMHTEDSYSGGLRGNYDKLAEHSDTQLLYKVTSIRISTTDLYRKKSFPIPLLMDAKLHVPLMGKNKTKETYFEFSVASFFKSSLADRNASRAKLNRKSKREKTASRRSSQRFLSSR